MHHMPSAAISASFLLLPPQRSRRSLDSTQEDATMAGESANFGLRNRAPTPAISPFELPPRLQPLRQRADASLAEPFRGIAFGNDIHPGVFSIERTGVSLAPVLE